MRKIKKSREDGGVFFLFVLVHLLSCAVVMDRRHIYMLLQKSKATSEDRVWSGTRRDYALS